MGVVNDQEFEDKCPHCKKKVKIIVQTKDDGYGEGVSWAGVEKP